MGTLKMMHFGDTHNGYSGNPSRYNEYKGLRIEKTNEKGINVRQDDLNQAFSKAIDEALEEKVDIVLHSGDLFDSWGYKQPVVLNFIYKQIKRLSVAGIPTVIIIGNHDLPKVEGKGTYLEALGELENVYVVYKGFYEKVEFENLNLVVHCIPSTFTQDLLDESFEEAKEERLKNLNDGKIHVGMGHFGVTTIKHYAENALNSLVVDLDRIINLKMDYFALADFHETMNFGNNIWYSGSTERMGFGEIHCEPKVLIVDIDQKTKAVDVKGKKIEVRKMFEIPEVDVKGKKVEEVNRMIIQAIESHEEEMKDAIVRFRVKHLPVHLKRLIQHEKIKELTKDSLYFKLEYVDKTNSSKDATTSETKFVGVLEGIKDFIDSVEDDGTVDKEVLKNRVYQRLLRKYEEEA